MVCGGGTQAFTLLKSYFVSVDCWQDPGDRSQHLAKDPCCEEAG